MRLVKRFILITILSLSGMLAAENASAQCPMCKMSAESNLKNGGTAGKGLNAGILYMLAIPYTLVGVVGYIWWRHNRRRPDIDDFDIADN